ncbi:MAG TPA: phosphotransferase, partial [Ktedonobacterales bacterium]|nr:phosphotransferase [Ktedonobacterales bacterium]
MGADDFFAQAALDLEAENDDDLDARLGALLQLYLRGTFDAEGGCWTGRDEHDTLRRTCHAVEVLHRLNLDSSTERMVREAGNWLINLPVHDRLPPAERTRARLYPSRFKTLAYLRRFDDALVRRDFSDLLSKEVGGMIRGVTASDVLTTCIVLDTLLTLERDGLRRAVCADERYESILAALRHHVKQWRAPDAPVRTRKVSALPASTADDGRPPDALTDDLEGGGPGVRSVAPVARARRRSGPLTEIAGMRDLSYALGLLLTADRANLAPRQVANVIAYLTQSIERRDRTRTTELGPILYAALQLAEHGQGDDAVRDVLRGLLRELRATYATPDGPRRWDIGQHTLVLRFLLTYYGEATLARGIAAYFLRQAEQRRVTEESTLEAELKQVIRERVEVAFGAITELSGGFTGDQIFRVPFSYWYPIPGEPGGPGDRRFLGAGLRESSVIIKRSTSDAFHTATENYRQLPPLLRRFFVRQPTESQVYKSGLSSAYYLTMEDLASLNTFASLVNEWDQRAMSDSHARLLRAATELAGDAVFTLFRETLAGRSAIPGTQIARLYLSPIEGKLARAVQRVPWLKNPLQGYVVSEQRYKGLDHYLAVLARHGTALQPRTLGLTHGDLHAGNVMLDRYCTQIKLIDLDKLSWTGDYLADMGNLLTDVCIYRRVAEPHREFGLAREEIAFPTRSQEPGTAENIVQYPALARPATLAFQRHLLAAIDHFATEIEDRGWKPRLWLAAASALFVRLAFQKEKEPAAVLYGEGIRLLHELTRYLEQGQELPDVLVPDAWPAAAISRGLLAEMPDWV